MVKQWFNFAIFFIALFCSACSENNNQQTIESEDFLPQAKGEYDYTEDSLSEDKPQLSEFQLEFKRKIPSIKFTENNLLKERDVLFMPDRLGYNKKSESYFMKDSIPFHIIKWSFEDSLKTVNAFYNWLDCFNQNCRSIRVNEEINGSKEAFVIWVSNTEISFLESSKAIQRKMWERIFFKETDWNYVIQQAPQGKMNWVISATNKKEKAS
jgi:hypothetical protein